MKFEDLENFRLEYKHKADHIFNRMRNIYLCLIGVLFVLLLPSGSTNSFFILIPFAFESLVVCFIVGFFWLAFSTKDVATNYRRAYKAYFVSDVLSKTFTDYQYKHDAGIGRHILNNTGVMTTGDRYHSNDYVSGFYNGLHFTQADVHIEEEHTDSDGDTSYSTIFKGRWMIFEFSKKFDKKLTIVGKGFLGSRAPKSQGFKRIELESPDFNKHFKVWTQDGFEAYYIMDPAFMERVTALAERYNDRVFLGFIDNKLHIGIHDGKDSLEPPSFRKPIDEEAEKTKIQNDIKVITDVVDNLKLR